MINPVNLLRFVILSKNSHIRLLELELYQIKLILMLWEVTLHDVVRVTSQKTKILCYTSVKISNSSIILGRSQVDGVQTLLKVVIHVCFFYYY